MAENKLDNQGGKWDKYLVNDGGSKWDKYAVPETDLKKKAGNLPSSGIPSRLQSEPNFLQQGQKMASGEIFKDISASVPKTTLKEAVIKDKNNNNSYLGAMWNNVVASAERLAGGAARLAQKFDTSPVSMIQESVDKAASSVTGINYEAQREKEIADKVKSFIGKARTSASSREYEQGLAEGFDITNGIGLDDLKGLGAVLPSMLADIAIAAPTGGTSFAIQGYDDALSTIDNIPEAKNMSETTRTAFGFGGAIISGVLEKLGMDNILKSGTATKYVTAKILKEAAGELAKKGVKVTAEQFEKAVANKATQMLTRTALKNTVKAGVKAGKGEAITEATQEGAMDLMKLATNQLEGKEIFDENDMKNTAASRYLNAAAMGGIFGGGLGSITSRTKNVQQHIEDEVKNAKTQEDINNIVNEINQSVQEGVISKNDAEIFKSMVDDNLSKPSSLDIENEKEVKLADIDSQIASLNKEDRLYNDNLSKLNKERNETISYYDNLSKQSQKDEETSFDDGKITPAEEIVTEEVTPTEVEVTEGVSPKIEKPSAEQQAKESAEGNTVTFTYKTEAEVPEVFKDRITSYGENKIGLFGKKEKIVRVTVPKSLADYELGKVEQPKTEVEVAEEVKTTELGVDLKSPEKMNASQNRYGIVKEGKDAGFIVTSNPKDGVVKVQGVTVNEDLRGKGLAGEAYIKLGKDLAKDGISLASDSFDKMEPSAIRVWDKLVERGLAEKGENNYELKKPEAVVKTNEVKVTEDIESKKNDIEGERQAELDNLKKGIPAMITKKLELGLKQYGFTDAQINKMTPIVANETLINAKYDEKLAALESGKAEVKPTKEKEEVESPKPAKEVPKDKKLAQAYKDLTRNEKRQIINSKFDELIKVLKIEKICPT
jgi:ribosomal protein S20